MSARSPFRSHLLQQWTNSRRSPIVVQKWLHQETIHEEEEEGEGIGSPSRSHPQSRRSFHSSPSQQHESFDLSSVDTTPTIALAATQSSWAASLHSETKPDRIREQLYSKGRPASADCNKQPEVDRALFDVGIFANTSSIHEQRTTKAPQSKNDSIVDIVGGSTNSSWHLTNSKRGQPKDPREVQLAMAIDRAVKNSKSTHKHRLHASGEEGGQLLTFRRLFSWSRSGQRLTDISFEATLRSTGNDATARKEMERWSRVPAFLVAIVHENQAATTTTTTDARNDYLYAPLGYSPPTTEGQLQDYASACAAAQTAIHSLQGDGYSTEWVTSSVTKTPAFRKLLKVKPTDRIAALITVDDRPKSEQHLSSR